MKADNICKSEYQPSLDKEENMKHMSSVNKHMC